MAFNFDLVDYLDVPEFDVAEAVTLGVALLASVPGSSPASVREPALALRIAVLDLQRRWADQSADAELALSRVDARVGNAWIALHAALKAATRLPSTRERSQLAVRLLRSLFPHDLAYLDLPSIERHGACKAICERIESEQLARPISLATGHPEFLEELLEAQEALDRFDGSKAGSPSSGEGDLGLALCRFRESTAQYVLQLAAWCARHGRAGDTLLARTLSPAPGSAEHHGVSLASSTNDIEPQHPRSLRWLLAGVPPATPSTPVPSIG